MQLRVYNFSPAGGMTLGLLMSVGQSASPQLWLKYLNNYWMDAMKFGADIHWTTPLAG